MAGKFHINGNNEAMPCKASVRSCRFGDSDHFTDEKAAQTESENRLSRENGGTVGIAKKKSPPKAKKTSESKFGVKANASPTEQSTASGSRGISRIKNPDVVGKSALLGSKIRFRNDATIEDVERTAKSIEIKLEFSKKAVTDFKVEDVHGSGLGSTRLSYVKNEDKFVVNTTKYGHTEYDFVSKNSKDALLFIADKYRFDDDELNIIDA